MQAGGDHYLGVAPAHAVVGHHRRLDARARTSSREQAQRDVEHDAHVDPGVVGHAEPVGVHLLHVPPGREAARPRWPRPAAPRAGGCRAWERRSPSPGAPRAGSQATAVPPSAVRWDVIRAPDGRTRTADLRPPRLGHRPLQLPLPVLHARGRAALARARGDPALRGDRADRAGVRADGRDRRPADRRRAARPARVPAAAGDARADARASRTCRSPPTATCSSATPRRSWPPGSSG